MYNKVTTKVSVVVLILVVVLGIGYIGAKQLSSRGSGRDAVAEPAGKAIEREAGKTKNAYNKTDFSVDKSWKTYHDKEYFFEIRYPDNFKINTTGLGSQLISDEPPAEITFSLHDNTNLLPISEWVKSDLVIHDLSVKWNSIAVDGIESLKSPVSGNMDGGVEYDVLIPRHDKIYHLLFSTKAPGTKGELEIFDQILYTLRFIENK